MHVAIEAPGPVSEARKLLAKVIAREAFGALASHVESVSFGVPPSTHSRATSCHLRVRLKSGAQLGCRAAADNMADALERAAHEMRRRILARLGLPLPARHAEDSSDPRAERRAADV